MMLLILAAVVVSSLEVQVETSNFPLEEVVSWEEWKGHFGFEFTRLEELHRKKIFLENVNSIMKHNAEGHNWRMGVNQFTHLSSDEWAARFANNTFEHKPAPGGPTLLDVSAPLASVDWRGTAVTDVKNQGSCGSCWAFSTTGAIEGAWQIKHNTLVSLSEEELVQCDRTKDNGCQGGLMDYGFEFVEKNDITSEDAYPYTSAGGRRGTCKSPIPAAVATVTSYTDVTPDNAVQLQAAIAKGPVSIAVEADKSAWQSYRSGIMDSESCGTNLDHGVLAVGYNTADGYWIVKNSWGTTWGEAGYIRLGISSSSKHGICGLLSQPSYPIVGDSPGPGPAPGPTPTPAPGGSHYEEPPCASDEQAVRVQGVDGSFCSPACGSGGTCPDAPADVNTAINVQAQCALKTTSGDQYCALTCTPSFIDTKPCLTGSSEMTCKRVNFSIGLCTYGDDLPDPELVEIFTAEN